MAKVEVSQKHKFLNILDSEILSKDSEINKLFSKVEGLDESNQVEYINTVKKLSRTIYEKYLKSNKSFDIETSLTVKYASLLLIFFGIVHALSLL